MKKTLSPTLRQTLSSSGGCRGPCLRSGWWAACWCCGVWRGQPGLEEEEEVEKVKEQRVLYSLRTVRRMSPAEEAPQRAHKYK